MARASRAPSVSVWTPRGEHRRKAFTLRHPHHRPSFYSCIRTVYCMLYRFSAGISYYCYLFTFLLVYIVLILDCVGYFHRPKKPLIQSRYTHISECFLLARDNHIERMRQKHVQPFNNISHSQSFPKFNKNTYPRSLSQGIAMFWLELRSLSSNSVTN